MPRSRSAFAWLLTAALLVGAGGWVSAGAATPPLVPLESGLTAYDGDEPRVEGRLVVHPNDTEGGPVRVGLLLRMDPGWHVYARDPGDTGLPTEVEWSATGGAVQPRDWPAPLTYEDEIGFVSYGYESSLLLAADAVFESGTSPRRVRADVELLACEVECIPGSLTLELALDTPRGEAESGELREIFSLATPGAPRTPDPRAGVGVWEALLLALVGGLLLNLMPCVLPVLALKTLALAELAERGPRDAAPHALAYVAGIQLSMLALASTVLALRAAGTAVGWGFQFQEPRFVVAVCAVVVLFALNLFGVFEIGVDSGRLANFGSQAVGPRRSFFDGLLTVTLATPCSAPFLGTAVGFAFAASWPVVVGVFLTIGAGLAAPVALVAVLPGSRRWMPRAGPWMLELRAGLGFVLIGAAVWLLWIAGRSLDVDGMLGVLAFLTVVAFGAWLYGRLQHAGRSPRPALAGAAALVLLALGVGAVNGEPVPADGGADARSEAYRPELVSERLAEGRPVFLYFTADWCITCKVNERLVIRNERVQASFERNRVAVLRADWTLRDETIRAELARFGRSGVPVYVIFSPAAPGEPTLLPEVLTVDRLVEALRAASEPARVTAITRPASRAPIKG